MDTSEYMKQVATVLFTASSGVTVLLNCVTKYRIDEATLCHYNPEAIPKVVGLFRTMAEALGLEIHNKRCTDCFGIGDSHGSIRFVSTDRPQDIEGFFDIRYEWTIGQAVVSSSEMKEISGGL